MAASHTRQALEELARAVERHAGHHGAVLHARVLDLCAEAVAFAREGDRTEARVRARSSAHLLLELVCPHLDAVAVRGLAAACGRAAVQLG